MVRGFAMAVTAVAATYQWAEIESTARGRGREAPSAFQARVQEFTRTAFRGLPCPRNSAGRRALMRSCALREQLHRRLVQARPQREAFARAGHVTHRDLYAAGRRPHGNSGLRRELRPALAARRASCSAWAVLGAVAAVTSFWMASATACGSRSYGTITESSSHSHWPEVEKLK